ncbi:MAG: hypothetical protein WD077_04620 [Bacteroidia bacterium]
MSEKSRIEIVLEFTRLLLWPILAIAAFLWFKEDVTEMLKSRTFKFGVFEVGDRIQNLENNVQGELIQQKDYLDSIRNNSTRPEKVEKYVDLAVQSLEKAQTGVKKDVQEIQRSMPDESESLTSASERNVAEPKTANEWERIGFEKILEKEIEPAIEAFTMAERRWPTYHNVAEIRRLLVNRNSELQDKNSPKWTELNQKILADYSWGMPPDARRKMQKTVD